MYNAVKHPNTILPAFSWRVTTKKQKFSPWPNKTT